MKSLKQNFFVVSHTHWDREWYLTFEQFRFKLVKLIDNLLDILDKDKEYVCFHLDGQTIVIDDYLAIRPEKREKLESYIRQNKIIIGPWYIQNDLFLTSAESTVRNLITGIKKSRKVGSEMKIGYLPDHFGIIGQMPQIFKLVGIDNIVFGRGYDHSKYKSSNFIFKAPDKSEVLAVHLSQWYNNAQRFPSDKENLIKTFEMIRMNSKSNNDFQNFLLMNGVDHLEPQEDITTVLKTLNEEFGEELIIKQAPIVGFVNEVKKHYISNPKQYPVLEGELREGSDYSILAGTLSARRYIKKENMECSDLIEKWLEPVMSFNAINKLHEYDSDYMRYIWETYMENHPHDSICGCSQDEVHRNMMDRFTRVKEVCNDLLTDNMEVLIRQIDKSGFNEEDKLLLVINTSQEKSNKVLRTEVEILESENADGFKIVDENNNEVHYILIDKFKSRVQRQSPINLPQVYKIDKYIIDWQPELDALSYKTYRIIPGEKGNKFSTVTEENTLENEFLKIIFNQNGSFSMEDKCSGKVYDNQGLFEDIGDRGDLYVFLPADNRLIFNGDVQFGGKTVNDLYQEIKYSFDWDLPVCLEDDLKTRSENLKRSHFEITCRLENKSNDLIIKISIINAVKDHRLRILFDLNDKIEKVYAGGQFDVIERDENLLREYERNSYIQPFWKFVAPVSKNGFGFSIVSKGTCEYETIDQNRKIAITLLRCVASINSRELPPLEIDQQIDSQCMGESNFEIIFNPIKFENEAQLLKRAELNHQGLKQYILPANDDIWQMGRAWVQDSTIKAQFIKKSKNSDKHSLPLSQNILNCEGDVIVSAIKQSEDKAGFIVRIFNPCLQDKEVKIKLHERVQSIEEVNLLEENLVNCIGKNELTAHIPAKAIKTYKLLFQ